MMQAPLALSQPRRRRPSGPLLALGLALALTAGLARADAHAEVQQLVRTGQHAQAMTLVERQLAARPRDPQLRFLKGVIQTETGQAVEALATFTRLTEDYPELPEPYNNLAALQAAQGRLDEARQSLEMAIQLKPGYATAHENLGDIQARLAAQAWSRAQQLEPANPRVAPKLSALRS
ncbi:tetratricopeptide repeat protein, partial [Ramlibacter sp. 2FC]|uniref:tetratricopeptide repeat protein n=1 Tax=Ramlibacter sp. 2FC TaxID=2502188 RepID=UPI00201DD9EC